VESIKAIELAYPIHLDGSAIESFIPHRKPMRFAETVTVLANNHYTGTALFASDSFVLQGHFPEHPIVPGVMIIEAGAQIAAAGLRAGDLRVRRAAKGQIGVLMAVRKCFFRKPVLPNTRLDFELHCRQISDSAVNVTGEVHFANDLMANLEFVFGQIDITGFANGLDTL
jgi:3-hydroxyacyl-[acyl-carrier-protein] dehydratase